MHKFLFFITSLLYASTCFEHCCVHHQEFKIVLYRFWYRHSLEVAFPCTGRPPAECDDTRSSIIQLRPPDDEHIVFETCRIIQQTYYKTKICALSWLITKIMLRCTVSKQNMTLFMYLAVNSMFLLSPFYLFSPTLYIFIELIFQRIIRSLITSIYQPTNAHIISHKTL